MDFPINAERKTNFTFFIFYNTKTMHLLIADDLIETINETRRVRNVDVDVGKLIIEKYELILSRCTLLLL